MAGKEDHKIWPCSNMYGISVFERKRDFTCCQRMVLDWPAHEQKHGRRVDYQRFQNHRKWKHTWTTHFHASTPWRRLIRLLRCLQMLHYQRELMEIQRTDHQPLLTFGTSAILPMFLSEKFSTICARTDVSCEWRSTGATYVLITHSITCCTMWETARGWEEREDEGHQ